MEHCSKISIAFVSIFLTVNLILLIWHSNTIANLRLQNNMQCTITTKTRPTTAPSSVLITTTTTEGLSRGIKVEKNCTCVIAPNCPKLNGKQDLPICPESKNEKLILCLPTWQTIATISYRISS